MGFDQSKIGIGCLTNVAPDTSNFGSVNVAAYHQMLVSCCLDWNLNEKANLESEKIVNSVTENFESETVA